MTKEQFLQSLRERLSDLSRDDCEERLTFYSEMIDDRMEEGMTEEEAVAAVGSADEIAGQIVEEYVPEKKEERETGKTALLIAGSPLWIVLLVAAFVVAISVYAVLWSVVVSLWAGFAGICGGAVGGILGGGVMTVVANVPSGLVLIAGGLVCTGLAIFFFFGCKGATKGMAWLTKKLVQCYKTNFCCKKGDAR